MTLIRLSRTALGRHIMSKAVCFPGRLANATASTAPVCSRCFYRGQWRDPFTQMEEFMRDMERKFKRDIDNSLSSFLRDFPRVGAQGLDTRSPMIAKPGFGYVENISTEDKYKLAFNFIDAKPEDVKVTLKGRTLTVSAKAVSSTETTKSSYGTSIEYQLPEEVNVDALESSFSHDGILTIEAPQVAPREAESSHTINITRED